MKPWYWRSLPLNNRTGAQIFAALFCDHAIATLLESPASSTSQQPRLARYSIAAGAPRSLNGCLQMWTPPIGEVLPFLQQLLQRSHKRQDQSSQELDAFVPFTGGWLGWLGYDFAWEIEKLPYLKPDTLPFPVAYWYEPDAFAILDHLTQTLYLAASEVHHLDKLQSQLDQKDINPVQPRYCLAPTSLTPSFLTSQADYEMAVRRAQKYIQAGDIFQANLSLRFETQTKAAGWEIYQTLQQINPSPFASYWRTPWGEVISASPERLVQLVNRQATTRPIAGTRSRGATPAQERQFTQDLLTNAKENAEHIMLVDLERNDLGRVCTYGSVIVDELLTIERYSHVMHLVSNITGTLSDNHNSIDLMRAMFPGGTITGCPKVRCMEIIEELEPVRRSLFYGSCGYLDGRGNLDLNILIRTLLLTPSAAKNATTTVCGQVGAGIVADSDPQAEWYESLHKAQAQLSALAQSRAHGEQNLENAKAPNY